MFRSRQFARASTLALVVTYAALGGVICLVAMTIAARASFAAALLAWTTIALALTGEPVRGGAIK